MKNKIAIVIDEEGWAFDNIAIQLKKNISKFDIDIIPMSIFGENAVKMIILSKKYDLMHFLWRGHISWLDNDFSKLYIRELGMNYEDFLNDYLKFGKISTAVYDHLFIESEKERTDFIFKYIKNYTVCSNKLNKIYADYPNISKPSMIVSDGVDLEKFYMKDKMKYNKLNGNIIIGWCGNSKFTDEKGDDLKGLNKIIKPAIKELKDEGLNVEMKIADRNVQFIPHEKMPDYYNSIDIYVCASRTEGTPNPVLESMACGVPVISTDVGIVSEVFGKKQKEFIIKRDKNDLKRKIKKLVNTKGLLNQLSIENLEQIKQKDWKKQSKLIEKFFDNCIRERRINDTEKQ